MKEKCIVLFFQMIPTLQQLAFRLVPTYDVLETNLIHQFGFQNRFVQDLLQHPIDPIHEYFLSALLDSGNTSLFWMMKFINRQIHRLPFNTIILACWQEYYRERRCLMAFAMRTHWNKVVMFVYTLHYDDKKKMTKKIFNQKPSHQWTQEDWEFVSILHLEQLFSILSQYKHKIPS